MRRFKRKMLLMCSIAMILSGCFFLGSCEFLGPNSLEAVVFYTAWWAGYSFLHGSLEGAITATVESGVETENLQVIEDDWNGFWKSVGDGISNGWNTLVNGATELWTGITSIF